MIGATARIIDNGDEVIVVVQDQNGQTVNENFYRGMEACQRAVQKAASDLNKYR